MVSKHLIPSNANKVLFITCRINVSIRTVICDSDGTKGKARSFSKNTHSKKHKRATVRPQVGPHNTSVQRRRCSMTALHGYITVGKELISDSVRCYSVLFLDLYGRKLWVCSSSTQEMKHILTFWLWNVKLKPCWCWELHEHEHGGVADGWKRGRTFTKCMYWTYWHWCFTTAEGSDCVYNSFMHFCITVGFNCTEVSQYTMKIRYNLIEALRYSTDSQCNITSLWS